MSPSLFAADVTGRRMIMWTDGVPYVLSSSMLLRCRYGRDTHASRRQMMLEAYEEEQVTDITLLFSGDCIPHVSLWQNHSAASCCAVYNFESAV